MELTTTPEGREADILALFAETFTASEGAAEGRVIGALAQALLQTTAPADLLVCAALDGDHVIGSIMFSRLTYAADPRAVFVLGPVAVRPGRQGRGIGQRLIAYGLEALRDLGAEVALTYGDPGFYTRVGFHPVTEAQVAAPFPLTRPEGWLGQSLTDRPLVSLAGPVTCVPAFDDPTFW